MHTYCMYTVICSFVTNTVSIPISLTDSRGYNCFREGTRTASIGKQSCTYTTSNSQDSASLAVVLSLISAHAQTTRSSGTVSCKISLQKACLHQTRSSCQKACGSGMPGLWSSQTSDILSYALALSLLFNSLTVPCLERPNLLPPEWRVPTTPETALCLPTAKGSIGQGVSQLSCAITCLFERTATLTSRQMLLKCSGLHVLLKLQASVMA